MSVIQLIKKIVNILFNRVSIEVQKLLCQVQELSADKST